MGNKAKGVKSSGGFKAKGSGNKAKGGGGGPGRSSSGVGKPKGKGKGRPGTGGAGGPGAGKKRAGRPAVKTDEEVQVPAGPDEEDLHVSDDDFDFVSSYGSGLGFLTNEDFNPDSLKVTSKQKKEKKASEAADRDDDQGDGKAKKKKKKVDEDEGDVESYEAAPRTTVKEKKPERSVLPIKTDTGAVVFEKADAPLAPMQLPTVAGISVQQEQDDDEGDDQEPLEEVEFDDDDDEEEEEEGEDGDGGSEQQGQGEAGAPVKGPDGEATGSLLGHEQQAIRSELLSLQEREAFREESKIAIASAAAKVTQDPEKSLGELRTLLQLSADGRDAQVSCWAMLSLLMVFRDILPGYRIRLPTAQELQVQVSKEVEKLRDFESRLLRGYQAYIKLLLQAARGGKGAGNSSGLAAVSQTAVRCMAGLLETHYYFNYAGDLLSAVVPFMIDRRPGVRKPACDALAAIVRSDTEGQIAMEAVQLAADAIKRRKCMAPPDIVWALLEVKVTEVSREELERLKEAAKGGKIKKGKKKKGKTAEDRQLEKDFREAAGEVDVKARVRLQSRMLDALFEVFFRVLKTVEAAAGLGAVSSKGGAGSGMVPKSPRKAAKLWPLLEPTLAGIERFSHFISVEFFGDLLACMGAFTAAPALPGDIRARALLAISGVLSGQGSALTVDHHSFHCSLFRLMLDAPLQPLDEDWDDEAEDAARNQGPAQTTLPDASVMVLQALERGVVAPKSTDVTRLSNFVKRAAGAATGCETGDCMGHLCAVGGLLRRNLKLRGMLEPAMGRGGVVSGLAAARQGVAGSTPEEADPAVGGCVGMPLWELALLMAHFNPEVAATAGELAAVGRGSGEVRLPGSLRGGRAPSEVAARFSTRRGGFRPPPQLPGKAGSKRKRSSAAPQAALPTGAIDGVTDDDFDSSMLPEDVPGAAASHFRVARAFLRNTELRRQSRRLEMQIHRAKEHAKAGGRTVGKAHKSMALRR